MSGFNPKDAKVDDAKIVDYLLATAHPVGGSKARFFIRFGFAPDRPEEFAQALRSHAETNPVVEESEMAYGTKWTVEGPLNSPDERAPIMRSVWILDIDEEIPRLVTAFPVRKEKDDAEGT